MTKVGLKTWSRETDSQVFERGMRNVIVTLAPGGVVSFRLKGTRRSFDLTAAKCYTIAVNSAAFKQRMGKAKARKHKIKRSMI